MLMGLRAAAEAVLVGAGTVRAENYGRLLPGAAARASREERGLPPDPLAVLVSNRLELPWDAGLFTSGAGEVLVFTGSEDDPPDTATPVRVVRHNGRVDLRAALEHLRTEEGIRALLSEGGPSLHGALLDAGLVDELFVTLSPKLGGGAGPRMVEGLAAGPLELELRWLLHEGDELFARYAVRGLTPAAG
jgi:riboflavin biosynthesis pyrimidine reductase